MSAPHPTDPPPALVPSKHVNNPWLKWFCSNYPHPTDHDPALVLLIYVNIPWPAPLKQIKLF